MRGLDLAALLLVFAALSVAFVRVVPLFEAPDEPSHLHYAGFLAWEGRPPGTRAQLDVPGEGMQQPLYYAWLVPWLRVLSPPDPVLLDELRRIDLFGYLIDTDAKVLDPVTRIEVIAKPRGQFYRVTPELDRLRALRFATLPFGMLAVAFTFAAMRRASGSRPLAFLSASLLAFTPQIVFVSSYLNNDAAAAAFGAAGLWWFVRCAQRPELGRRDYLCAALLFVFAAFTKYSAVPALAVTCLALPLVDARPWSARARDAALAALVGLSGIAALAVLNQVRFGEPTATGAMHESWSELAGIAEYGGPFEYFTHWYAMWTFQSYWARFGWMNLSAPFAVYLACFALMWTGLLGFALSAWRAPTPDPAGPTLPVRWLRRYLTAVALATWAAHIWLNTRTAAAQGRHMFPGAPALACMLAIGIAWLASGSPYRVGWRPAVVLAGSLVALTIYCLVMVVAPAYPAA